MRNSKSTIGIAVLLAATLGAGTVQGFLTNRWALRADAALAAQRLRPTLPIEVGAWRLRHEGKLSPEVIRMLQCPAYISRVYEHQQTGDVVRLFVLVGSPGPVAVHTPEICGVGRDYTIAAARQAITIQDAGGQEHSLWSVPMKSNSLEGAPIRVLYGWSVGTGWAAAERPRFAYGGLPHLYKLQMEVTTNSASKAVEFDPGRDFLESFLPQLQPQMVEARNGWNMSL